MGNSRESLRHTGLLAEIDPIERETGPHEIEAWMRLRGALSGAILCPHSTK